MNLLKIRSEYILHLAAILLFGPCVVYPEEGMGHTLVWLVMLLGRQSYWHKIHVDKKPAFKKTQVLKFRTF